MEKETKTAASTRSLHMPAPPEEALRREYGRQQDGQLVSPKTIDSNAFPYYYEATPDRLYYFSNYSAKLIDPFESADLYCWNGETTTAIVHDISSYCTWSMSAKRPRPMI